MSGSRILAGIFSFPSGLMRVDRQTLLKAWLPLAALSVPSLPRGAVADQDKRTIAQSVGIDQKAVGVLADPRALIDGDGVQPLIWGARDRCDPTDATCKQGGIESSDFSAEAPPSLANVEVTDRVKLLISIGGEKVGSIEIGLWRKSAPKSVDTFVQLVAGTLGADPSSGEEPASLDRSVALRVQRGKAIVLGGLKQQGGSMRLISGQTRPKYVPIPPPAIDDAPNGVSHAAAGLLSWAKAGGSFEFSLTPRANLELDASEIVFGQVLNQEGMDVLERMNAIPTNNYNGGPMATIRVERAQLF